MIPVAEAVARVSAGFSPLPPETVVLAEALGRVLAEDVAARLSHPPLAVSSMDGYAVRTEDVAEPPATLRRIGESAAGSGFDGIVAPGTCVRIFTGAALPAGADAIVIQEDTDVSGDAVTMKSTAPKGRFVRAAGMDFAEGDVLLRAGQVLTARDLGLAASMNVPWLAVHRRPRVAVLATGDELAMPGEALRPGQIVSSNSLALCAYVRAFGGEPINLGIARDNEDSLRRMLAAGTGADLLVTIGGASVGDHDLVRKVLDGEGFALDFFRVAMRPGKPFIFGHLGPTPVLGLPGNPVSVGVTSLLYLRPAIRRMLGAPDAALPLATAVLGVDLPANDERQDYLRARYDRAAAATTVVPFRGQDSAMMARLAEAECLVIRAPFSPPAKAGETVEIVPLAGIGPLGY